MNSNYMNSLSKREKEKEILRASVDFIYDEYNVDDFEDAFEGEDSALLDFLTSQFDANNPTHFSLIAIERILIDNISQIYDEAIEAFEY